MEYFYTKYTFTMAIYHSFEAMKKLLKFEKDNKITSEENRFIILEAKVRVLRHFIAEYKAKSVLPFVIKPRTRLEAFHDRLWLEDEWEYLKEELYSRKFPSNPDT